MTKVAPYQASCDIPDLPYPSKLIRPDLQKPGLHVFGPEEPEDYAFQLLKEQLITRETLRQFGFVLFENQRPTAQREKEHKIPEIDSMVLHQDPINRANVVGLRFPEQPVIRPALTVLSDRDCKPKLDPCLTLDGLIKNDRSALAGLLTYFNKNPNIVQKGGFDNACWNEWRQNQLMFIDNHSMLHGRLATAPRNEKCGYLFREWFKWSPSNELTPVDPF